MNKTRQALIDYLENKQSLRVLLNAIDEEDIEMAKLTKECGMLICHHRGDWNDTNYRFTSKHIIQLCNEGIAGSFSLHHLNMISVHISAVLIGEFNKYNAEKDDLIKALEPWADYDNDIPLTWEIVRKKQKIY